MPEPVGTVARNHAAGFDRQAHRYDERVGIPPEAGTAVARAVVDIVGDAPDDLVVEIGAGTGEVGMHLAAVAGSYVGLDASPGMLGQFRRKTAGSRVALVAADCDRDWPVRSGIAGAVVGSRVVHLLDRAHVVREVRRVCRPGGWVVLGRVVRDRDGVSHRMRKRRQELLAAAGIVARDGDAGTRRVVGDLVAAGGEFAGGNVVADWVVETTPATVLAAWRSLARMGSVEVAPASRDALLAALEAWAREAFGDLGRSESSREQYVVQTVRLP